MAKYHQEPLRRFVSEILGPEPVQLELPLWSWLPAEDEATPANTEPRALTA